MLDLDLKNQREHRVERRHFPRVLPKGRVRLGVALRASSKVRDVTVLDLSLGGFAVVASFPLTVAMDEQLFCVLHFSGFGPYASVQGALLRLHVRRRSPHLDGYMVGLAGDDVRTTPWSGFADWIEQGGPKPVDNGRWVPLAQRGLIS